ncbi:MAG: hypothetical protein CM1200mP34_3360 [Verrucomicrobiales bacterium]|nr:MAG: hypothetical protein CM1200mP34_3360 [Verrucomicrobiales bacterium]
MTSTFSASVLTGKAPRFSSQKTRLIKIFMFEKISIHTPRQFVPAT